jgi:hypothetical protein
MPEIVGRSRPAQNGLPGSLWIAGWLFTVAFAKLVWWKALLAIIVWPYFLGAAIE